MAIHTQHNKYFYTNSRSHWIGYIPISMKSCVLRWARAGLQSFFCRIEAIGWTGARPSWGLKFESEVGEAGVWLARGGGQAAAARHLVPGPASCPALCGATPSNTTTQLHIKSLFCTHNPYFVHVSCDTFTSGQHVKVFLVASMLCNSRCHSKYVCMHDNVKLWENTMAGRTALWTCYECH